MKVRGFGFRLTGLILGIIGAVVSITSVIFSAVGLHLARVCKRCKMDGTFQ